MSHQGLWWTIFLLALAGNVFCWAIVILRLLQNFGESSFAKICLVSQLIVPVGFTLAFVFGWVRSKKEGLRTIMTFWTASLLVFGVLGLLE